MAARSAFVDESTTQHDYVVCAILLGPHKLEDARRALKQLRMPGQRRIHMTKECDSRRRRILSAVADLELEAVLYRALLDRRPHREARDDCLRAMVPDLLARGAARLAIESCDQDRQDRQIIGDVLAKERAHDRLAYRHEKPSSEPLLWLPDIIGWAYTRGGDWYRRARSSSIELRVIDA
ncbi:hypothetical protein ACXC9Q_38845 (plasmid) [Kribbella sp. CWNU-51]